MLKFLTILAFIAIIPTAPLKAQDVPVLTDRIVDNANMLTPGVENSLISLLATHEKATTDQVVVVTLPSLGGYTIEQVALKLGNTWGIGQKDKNNGVLLVVAPNERMVRIEVGIGLETKLTDSIAQNIIDTRILPMFRQSSMEAGVSAGAEAIIQALDGEYVVTGTGGQGDPPWYYYLLAIPAFFMRGGSKGSGFRGGGGSFGGGGATGSW